MSPLPASESQESLLPMPVLASDALHATAIPLPVFLYDASAGQYALLATSDGDVDCASEDGTLAGDEDPLKAKSAHAAAVTDPESLQAQVQGGSSSYRAIAGTIWYLRMCLLLVILCTAVTLATGTIFAVIGNLVFLGSVEPYATMKNEGAEFTACAVGAGVLGCAVGLVAFVHLVVRRVRVTEHDLGPLTEARDECEGRFSPRTRDSEEPEELWTALAVAAVAGVLAMAVGMAVVRGLTTEAFGVRHALAVGAWGLGAPLTPMVGCMFVMTLWRCDPCAGAECCCEGVGACCDRE